MTPTRQLDFAVIIYRAYGPAPALRRLADPNTTVEALVQALFAEGLLGGSRPDGCLVLFNGRVVAVKQRLGDVFLRAGPGERSLAVIALPQPARAAILQLIQRGLEVRPRPGDSEPAAGRFEMAEEEIDFELTEVDEDTATGELLPPPAASAPPPPPPVVAAPRPSAPSRPARMDDMLGQPGPARSRRGRMAGVEDEDEVATRRATVRYYSRMNPEKVFPFLVVLSEQQIQKIAQRRVEQAESGPFAVKKDALLEVEPVLPGCTCYPSKAVLKVGSGTDKLAFWVVPHVRGRVKGAKVDVRQDGRLLAEVPLDIRVRRQTLAVISGLFTLGMPLASALTKHFNVDFAALKESGFQFYFQAWEFLLKQLSPVTLTAALAGLTACLYLWARPRRRDQFWDVTPA